VISKPILFSGPMVRGILEGRKTQTRRVVKTQPNRELAPYPPEEATAPYWNIGGFRTLPDASNPLQVPHPVGSEMWVRETWKYRDWTDDGEPFIAYRATEQDEPVHVDASRYDDDWGERLAEIWATLSEPENFQIDGSASDRKWRSPLFMPRWASRLTLTVKDVRVQRLQDISKEDAKAEGLKCLSKDGGQVWKWGIPDSDGEPGNDDHGWHWHRWSTSHIEAYRTLWESINGPGSWAANPWIWAYTFERVK